MTINQKNKSGRFSGGKINELQQIKTSLTSMWSREEQAEAWIYEREINLYYPLSSLRHLLGGWGNFTGHDGKFTRHRFLYEEREFGVGSNLTRRRSFLLHTFVLNFPNMCTHNNIEEMNLSRHWTQTGCGRHGCTFQGNEGLCQISPFHEYKIIY